jgi:hypothetical protein
MTHEGQAGVFCGVCSKPAFNVAGSCVLEAEGVPCDNPGMLKGCEICKKFVSSMSSYGEAKCMKCTDGFFQEKAGGECHPLPDTKCYDSATKQPKTADSGAWEYHDFATGNDICVGQCPAPLVEDLRKMRCECPPFTHMKKDEATNAVQCVCPEGATMTSG